MANVPYYEESGIQIYLGDCIDICQELSFDCVVTDPPYGIKYVPGKGRRRHSTKFGGITVYGDDTPFDPSPWLKWPCLLWGANHYANRLPGAGRWIVWDKRDGVKGYGKSTSDLEIAWMSGPRRADRLYRQAWDGFIRDGERGTPRVHPTQKPVKLMKWCMSFFKNPSVILDPYMGSGTTLIAARELGIKAIGIEIEEKYCEIAVKRLSR